MKVFFQHCTGVGRSKMCIEWYFPTLVTKVVFFQANQEFYAWFTWLNDERVKMSEFATLTGFLLFVSFFVVNVYKLLGNKFNSAQVSHHHANIFTCENANIICILFLNFSCSELVQHSFDCEKIFQHSEFGGVLDRQSRWCCVMSYWRVI